MLDKIPGEETEGTILIADSVIEQEFVAESIERIVRLLCREFNSCLDTDIPSRISPTRLSTIKKFDERYQKLKGGPPEIFKLDLWYYYVVLICHYV